MKDRKETMATNGYEKGDCCYATVTRRNSMGTYLKLDDGQNAFTFNAGNLQSGVRILCTIVKTAAMVRPGRRILVRLDSVCGLYDTCA